MNETHENEDTSGETLVSVWGQELTKASERKWDQLTPSCEHEPGALVTTNTEAKITRIFEEHFANFQDCQLQCDVEKAAEHDSISSSSRPACSPNLVDNTGSGVKVTLVSSLRLALQPQCLPTCRCIDLQDRAEDVLHAALRERFKNLMR